ncbi:TonB-dependent receptor [Sphingorhabdus lutea]|uniref:TonB-dependent receptor n=1 Tax=Sphingorhabdus lutea TaxID=1913578 RepID=A0A1L3JCX8_9SPHN|nr:TonB-dependent receptor [Sphingorhabdus lutea]APG62984.1 TonB-dependent receptor [Sphingorhabdus lutea]
MTNKNLKILLSASALSSLFIPAVGYAQSIKGDMPPTVEKAQDDFHNNPEIIVTAPYFEDLDFLAGTSALSGSELSVLSRGQIGDVLTKLPGVSATGFSPGASRPVIRGFSGNRVMVLTDGIGNIDASNTSADHAVTIESLTVERIEVLRGPAVLLFGGQAVGGAVNALDKRIPRSVPEETIHLDFTGSYSTAAKEGALGGSADFKLTNKLVAHVDGSYRKSSDLRTGGYVLSPSLREQQFELVQEAIDEGELEEAAEAEELANLRGRIPNSGVETWTAGTGISFIDDGGSLGISFSIYDTNYGVPEAPSGGHDHGGEEPAPVSIGLRQYRTDLRGEVEAGGFIDKIKLRAGYADYQHTEFEGDEVGTLFLSKGIESRLEFIQDKRGIWRGASGVQYQLRDFNAIGEEAFVPKYSSHQFGLFTLQELTFDPIDVEFALRYDHSNISSQAIDFDRNYDAFSAAIGVGYLIGDTKIGVNFSRTQRAPSAEELLSDGPHIATQAYEIGDTGLKTEKSLNAEIYARYNSNNLNLNATLYLHHFNDFIFEDATGAEEDDLPVFQYFQNDARFYGIETQADIKFATIGQADLWAHFVGDYTHAKVNNVGPVPRIPPLRLLGGLEWKQTTFDIKGEVEWNASQKRIATFETPTDSFTFVNLSATLRPFSAQPNISVNLAANNIFDVVGRRAASFTKDFVPLAGRDFRISFISSF